MRNSPRRLPWGASSPPLARSVLRAPVLAALILITVVLAAQTTPAREPAGDGPVLRLEARDSDGEPVAVTRTTLGLTAWGAVERVELPVAQSGTAVELPFSVEWLCEQWPERCRDVIEARLWLEAEGFAEQGSDPFPWPGLDTRRERPVRISFGDGSFTLPEGESTGSAEESRVHSMTVPFHAPRERRLRLATPDGPLAEVTVEVQRFQGALNHCGVAQGDRLLRATTDDQGRIPLPAGNLELAVTVEAPDHLLQDIQSEYFPRRWVGRPQGESPTLELRAMEVRTLEMLVTDRGEPAAGLTLYGCGAACGCGNCCGALSATTNDEGILTIEDFRPEKFAKVYFVGPDGQPIWEGYPMRWRTGQPLRLELAGRWVGDSD